MSDRILLGRSHGDVNCNNTFSNIYKKRKQYTCLPFMLEGKEKEGEKERGEGQNQTHIILFLSIGMKTRLVSSVEN